jgi:hypothetical protein
MKGKQSMKNESMSDHCAHEMNFKRPCWLALFVSLGAMLAGYNVYFGMFPYGQGGQLEAVSTWQLLPETGSFLLMAVGIFGFVASLVWWFVAAIKLRLRGSRRQPTAALATPSGVGIDNCPVSIQREPAGSR